MSSRWPLLSSLADEAISCPGVFITGTDTEVGKTLVSSALLTLLRTQGLVVAGMKPVASGCRVTAAGLRSDDAEQLLRCSNVDASYEDMNPYAFEPAIAPHIAAQQAGVTIDLELIRARARTLGQAAQFLVIEGVGGWMVPLGPSSNLANLAQALALPVIMVVAMRLGCLNHALLTQDAIASSGLSFGGWVANHIDPAFTDSEANQASLVQRLRAPCLATLPYQAQGMSPQQAAEYFEIEKLREWLYKT